MITKCCDAKVDIGDVVLFCTFTLFHVHFFYLKEFE